MNDSLLWTIALGTVAGMLFGPRALPEYVWAGIGAILLVLLGFVPLSSVGPAIWKGMDVYLFLVGMMLLAELARREGVFDWLAAIAVNSSKGSRTRLFTLVYLVAVVVTALLSNDATAVVLTPAVYAAARRARTKPLPYLLICAFVANAASFLLPISNPANLVVYGRTLPPLLPWIRTFLAPSVCSICATYFALRWLCRKDLTGSVEQDGAGELPLLSGTGRLTLWGIAWTSIVLIATSALGFELGLATFLSALFTVAVATRLRSSALIGTARSIAWEVLPLVAGLFVIVEALNRAGVGSDAARVVEWVDRLPRFTASIASAFAVAGLSNVTNNLPAGLLAGGALAGVGVPMHIRDAVLVGIDLGPNLSVTGSLATLLWLTALRREGVQISALEFLKAGLLVMPAALVPAVWVLSILAA